MYSFSGDILNTFVKTFFNLKLYQYFFSVRLQILHYALFHTLYTYECIYVVSLGLRVDKWGRAFPYIHACVYASVQDLIIRHLKLHARTALILLPTTTACILSKNQGHASFCVMEYLSPLSTAKRVQAR